MASKKGKGFKFGSKKKDLDDFMEAEFKKIKQTNPDFEEGDQEPVAKPPVEILPPPVAQEPDLQEEPVRKKDSLLKPNIMLKKGAIKRPSEQVSPSPRDPESSGPSYPSQKQAPIYNAPQADPVDSSTSGLPAFLTKPKAPISLPKNLIKPMKITKKAKPTFQMKTVEEELGIQNNFNLKKRDDEVESLMFEQKREPPKPLQPSLVKIPIKTVGPQKLLNFQKKVKDEIDQSRHDINQSRQGESRGKARPKAEDNDDDGYSDEDGFEKFNANEENVDHMEALRKKMKKDAEKAKEQNSKKSYVSTSNQVSQPKSSVPFTIQPGQIQKQQQPSTQIIQKSGASSSIAQPMGGFAAGRGLVMGEKIDYAAEDSQQVRAEELRELIELSQEEFFNVFEIVPQTKSDVYFSKLTAGAIKTAVVAVSDDWIDREVQTDEMEQENKFNQAPDDVMANYKKKDAGYQRKKKRNNEALMMEKFMARAGPMMEKVVEEIESASAINNRDQAKSKNAVELRSSLKLPAEVLILFRTQEEDAQLSRVTCIHMFENSPQSKCAVAYELKLANGDFNFIVVVYSTSASQMQRLIRTDAEVTQMCTSGDDSVLIIGSVYGSIVIYDLQNFETSTADDLNYNALLNEMMQGNDEGEINQNEKLASLRVKYQFFHPTFSTDGMPDYFHFSPIRKLVFINRLGNNSAQIGVIDELGIISQWSVLEIDSHVAEKMNDFELNLTLGGRYKLLENYNQNMIELPEFENGVFGETIASQSLELEFDPQDPNVIFFSTSGGLYRMNRRESKKSIRLDCPGLGAPSTISVSDNKFLIVGFTCGSIAIYDKQSTTPLTIWYQTALCPIMQIKWCLLYFTEDSTGSIRTSPEKGGKEAKKISKEQKFATRICEFFAIDKSEEFQIWNIQKSFHKPAHSIQFSDKHATNTDGSVFKISMTCPDQSFFTAFALADNSVSVYMMNFKKGSTITKEKLEIENKKSYKIYNTLPLNVDPVYLNTGGGM